jgi:ABC-type branched-subunit amino acid transport system ATPase component
MRLIAQDITVVYGSRKVLRNLNFEAPGQINLIVGQNGSGKSTLLRVLAGAVVPNSGSVVCNGMDISQLNRRQRLATGIVYVRQDQNIYPHLSVLENLRVASYVAAKRDRFVKTIDSVHQLFPTLRSHSSKQAGLMSGGEKKQLAIAMGFMQDPRVLLIDEPSTGLSPVLVEEVMNAIDQFGSSNSVAIIFAEQNIRRACRIASHVNLLVDGLIETLELHGASPEQYLAEIYSRIMKEKEDCVYA